MAPTLALSVPDYSLRAWRIEDAEAMARHLNNPNIGRHMADWYPQAGYTLALAQSWVTKDHIEFGGTNWAIDYRGESIGGAGVKPQNGFDRCNAEIGYWLSEQHWSKGVGTAAVAALTKFAFGIEGITRVYAPIHASNPRSQHVCEKNGFVHEGLQRLSTMKNGEAIDIVNWATYRDIWKNSAQIKK